MDCISNDVFNLILEYLVNDGLTVGRLALCSSMLYKRIHKNETIWEKLYKTRWTWSSRSQVPESYRESYFQRHSLDTELSQALYEMTEDLQRILDLEDGRKTTIDGDPRVGKEWGHVPRRATLMHRDCMDRLRQHAVENPPQSPTVFRRLLGFLACRCLQNADMGECLMDWKDLAFEVTPHTTEANLIQMENYAILTCQLQKNPEQHLNSTRKDVAENITNRLDDIADDCRNRIQEAERLAGKLLSISDKLLLAKDVIVKDHKFAGNEENYYDYRNSLLNHVLQSKKGIPITLCILFACVCRRVDLFTYLVGLPGHVVLGFQSDGGERGTGETLYLDVFRTGRVLSERDCQAICLSYGVPWNRQFLRPLTASQVFDRTFNNLSNCHMQAMANGSVLLFQPELFYQQRVLSSIHRHPKETAGHLVERCMSDLPLILSSDVLKHYRLLSSSDSPIFDVLIRR